MNGISASRRTRGLAGFPLVRYKREILATRLHQSCMMGLAINTVAAFLAFIAVASAVSPQFPHGKTVVYKYYGDVKAGIIEPAPYASQFALEGLVYVKHETSDPTLNNAYYVSLTNVKTGMYNGIAAHYEQTKVLTSINNAAKVIQDPFLIVYDESGRLQGVKISENEPGWSVNMKMAMASMLQLDLPNMRIEKPVKPHSFIVEENTIYGNCWITYDVHTATKINKLGDDDSGEAFVVTKFSSPKNCSGFSVNSFDHVDVESCDVDKEESVNVASRRVFEIEKQGEEMIIKKLVAHGGSNYFPWNSRSEAHYILNNATFALDRVVPNSAIDLPMVDFQDIPMIRDLTYRKPQTTYAPNTAVDVTQGRRVVDRSNLVPKIEKMLGEAADYIDENHLESKEPDWKHGQTINRILYTMSFMEIESFERVFEAHRRLATPRDITIQNIFLSIIPEVGTPATCLFTMNLIREGKVSDVTAIEMLTKLPLSVRVPTEKLLVQMENLVKMSDSISVEVRKSGILCFSSMIYRTMKNIQHPEENALLQRYLQHFFDLVKNEPSYELKMVYLMAMKNVEFGKIYEIVEPIIRGDLAISENPMRMRLMAIWAIDKAIEKDYHAAHDLLWPIMADSSLPVKLRIAAYEILMHQAPSMTDVLHLYWFMVYEKNEHLYNYHYTTIDGIANSVDPCKSHLRELVRKIMRFTRIHDTIHYTLSTAGIYDYKDELYNHAQKLRTGVIVNEITGVPEVMQLEHVVTEARRPVSQIEVRLHVQGCDEIVSLLQRGKFSLPAGLTDTNVLDLLKRAAIDMSFGPRKINVDLVILRSGRVVLASHYDEETLKKLYDDVKRIYDEHKNRTNVNYQRVAYDNLYEKRVVSDMGLAIVLENRVPILSSLKMNYDSTVGSTPITINFDIEAKIWRHGDYSMSIYNPMADTWHSIRRSTASDISLPIRAVLSYNTRTDSVKVTLPRLPATKFSVGGIFSHARDCVTVNEDDTDALKDSCPTCHAHEDVTRGVAAKRNYRMSVDSRDTGLAYSATVFDCENGATPVTMRADFYRALFSERKNDRNNLLIRVIMAINQRLKNTMISPSMGSCGGLVKIEPSIVHPTSHVDLSVRSSFEDVDHVNPSFHLFPSEKYNVRGKLDIVAASTNVTARSWDLNVNVDLEQAHTLNAFKVRLTRITPGEKNLKMCVDAQKGYTTMPDDPLKLGATREETNGKLTISCGETEDADECTRDDILVTMTIKGELSEEQRDKLRHEGNTSSGCIRDTNNSLYSNPKNIVPKTLNCLNDAIRYATLRKYSINVAHKKVPQEVTTKIQYLEDTLRTYLLPNLEYTMNHAEPGSIRVKVEFPVDKREIDVSVVTPGRSYDLLDVNFHKSRFEGFGPVANSLWYFPLDNTRFSVRYLYKYTHDQLKMCSIYPETVLTGDGKNLPFAMNDRWTLISGDHAAQNFAIFAKMVGANMALKIYAENHVVDIVPNASNEIRVDVDGETVERLENGVLVPADHKTWIVKITKNNEHTIVQMKGVPMMIAHGINHLALAIDTQLQGKISGLCGHLDGTYLTEIPKSYEM